MKSICGVNCSDCDYKKENSCLGCKKTNACPFGKKCFIAKYILENGDSSYIELKKQLIKEINDLKINSMEKLSELVALKGEFVNLEYNLSNGEKIKFLNNDEIYLGMQLECNSNKEICFGIVCNIDFILICKYGINGSNPELIMYRKR